MLNGKKVVLVVEDMPEYAELLCEMLRGKGHMPVPVCDLSSAWQTIEEIPGGLTSVELFIQDGSVSTGYTRRDGSSFRAKNGEKLPCTLEFIRDLRASGYTGPIMANSASGCNNDEMLKAGATHHGHGDTLRPWVLADKILSGEA